MYCHGRSITGLNGWWAAVAKTRELDGQTPLPRGAVFNQHKKGLQAIFGPIDVRKPAVPLTEDDLRALSASLNKSEYTQARFWFCAVVGFH